MSKTLLNNDYSFLYSKYLNLKKNNQNKPLNITSKKKIKSNILRINKHLKHIKIHKNIKYFVCYFHSSMTKKASNAYKGFGISSLSSQNFDYTAILKYCISRTLKKSSDVHVFLFINKNIKFELNLPNFTIINMNSNSNEVMYNRVIMFNSVLGSNIPNLPLIFLDSDAHIENDLHHLFKYNFDIGVTYRNTEKVMKINEGVIIINNKSNKSNLFFNQYLKIYDNLINFNSLKKYFPRPKLWRGGQFSLNLLCRSYENEYSSGDILNIMSNNVIFLPQNKFNFSTNFVKEKNYKTFVVHYKGSFKKKFNL